MYKESCDSPPCVPVGMAAYGTPAEAENADNSRGGGGAAGGNDSEVSDRIRPTPSSFARSDVLSSISVQVKLLDTRAQEAHELEDAFVEGVKHLHALARDVSASCTRLLGITTRVDKKYFCCCRIGFATMQCALRHHNGDNADRLPVHACQWDPPSDCPMSNCTTGTASRNAKYFSDNLC